MCTIGFMSDTKPLRAAIYARISLDRKEEAGVERQVHLCQSLADADEAVLIPDGIHVDNNISAFSGSPRPEYERLIRSVEADDLDVIYVYALDRLTRRTKDTLALFELCEKHHVTVKAARGYCIDPNDPTSRLIIVILGLIAEQESIDRAARVKSAYEDRARTGRPKTGGNRMFGYEVDAVTVNEPEAEVLREAAKMIVAGKTLREACRMINGKGFTTTKGAAFQPPVLRDLLLNPRANGKSTFTPTDETGFRLRKNRSVIGDGNWPAILDDELFMQVNAVLNDPSRRRNHVGTAPSRFLSGVLTCTCGQPMYHRTRSLKSGKKDHFYTCKREVVGGSHTSIKDDVDGFIEKLVFARMAKPDAQEVLRAALCPDDDAEDTSKQLQELTARRTELLARREVLEQQVVDGVLDTAVFPRLEAKFTAEIATIDDQVQKLTTTSTADPLLSDIAQAADFPAWWSSASIEDRRRLIKLLMTVHISKGKQGAKQFDPTRVKISWKS